MIKGCLKEIDRKKACQMATGICGIYVCYLIVGIIYQKITSNQYFNTNTQGYQNFRITSGYILIERSVTWVFGLIYLFFTIPKDKRVKIETKSSAATGFMIWFSSITQTEAMYIVSFPLIIMAKSCNLISVILVGVCCSRVRSKQLKIGSNKIIIAIVVTIGILMFRLFDPKANLEFNTSTDLPGLLLLGVSLFADGFVPDFQAQIKEQSKPSSIQMLLTINKWSAVFSFLYLTLKGQAKDMFFYCLYHPQFIRDILVMTVASFIGQLLMYRMIKEFKQHVVPFVATTRKIITVGLSIVYFHHQTCLGQISAIVLVLAVTIYEFIDNIKITQKQQPTRKKSSSWIKFNFLKKIRFKLVQIQKITLELEEKNIFTEKKNFFND